MKKTLLPCLFFYSFFFLLSYGKASAIPASPDIFELVQPDGAVFQAKQVGDEWNNRVETKAGYSVAKGPDNYWYHIFQFKGNAPVLSDIPAHRTPPPNLTPHASPDKAARRSSPNQAPQISAPMKAAPTGTFSGKILIILAQFTDKAGTYTEGNFATTISTISDYYSKASHGKVSFAPATESSGTANNGVIDWVDMGYNHPNTGTSITVAGNQKLSKDAITAADAYVDFSTYDTNADGYVDPSELGVVVIAAGYERSYSAANSPNLWGHKWQIALPPTVDGVKVGGYNSTTGVGGYAQFGEIHSDHQATLGIMVHELGHLFFDFPDLYDTDSSSSGIGAFGLMGHGAWGMASSDTYSGQTPVPPCAWSKLNRGWVDGAASIGTISITASGSTSATSANTVYKATTGTTNEYFLVENRQDLGYDKGLERYLGSSFGGLIIWHIDDNLSANTDDTHRWVDLEEADGIAMGSSKGSASELWYSGNASTFDDSSTPNSKVYAGTASGVSATSISASNETMSAYLLNSSVSPPASPAISVNSGAVSTSSTDVTLSLSATDDVGVTGYYVSETNSTPTTGASGWATVTSTASYSANVSFTLSSTEGSKTVYAWFKDTDGYVSSAASDSIALDTTAPSNPSITINGGDATVASPNVTVILSAMDSLGVTGYYLSENSTTPSSSTPGWVSVSSSTNYSTSVSHTLSSLLGLKAVYAWFKDAADNISSTTFDTITVVIPALSEIGLRLLALLFIPLGIWGVKRRVTPHP